MAENVASSTQFNPTVQRIVTQALRNLGVLDNDEEPTGDQYVDGVFRLNGIVKTLEATGIHVWTEEEGIVFFQLGIPQYLFNGTADAVPGTSGLSMAAMACDADNWVSFPLLSSYAAGTTEITLDVPSDLLEASGALGLEGGGIIGLEGGGEIGLEGGYGVSAGDNIGIVLDDGPLFWTTVESVAGAVVTLAAGLPGTASQGNLAIDFPPGFQLGRPLRIPKMRLYTYASASQTITPMTVLSRQGYMDLPQPRNLGVPTQFYYSPQRSTGRLYVWPNVMACNWAGRFTFLRPLADLLEPNNTMDFPQEWVKPCEWLLSDDMLPGYSVPPARAKAIQDKAGQMMELVTGWDRDSEDVQFGIDWQSR